MGITSKRQNVRREKLMKKKTVYVCWDDIPLYLQPSEVALLLGLHEAQVRAMCRQGLLPAIKLGKLWRFERDRLRLFLDTQFE